MMNFSRLFPCIFLGLLLLGMTLGAVAGVPDYRPGELLVKYRDAATASKAVPRVAGAVMQHRQVGRALQRLRLPAGVSVTEAVARYRSDPDVLYAEPNYIVRKAVLPNDFRYTEQWAAAMISLPQAWNVATGNGTIIAILDTGIDYFHEDLAANMWVNAGEVPGDGLDNDNNGYVDDIYGYTFNGGLDHGDPMDDDTADAHGTHVAGIAGAVGNNSIGISGVNWRVKLMAVKVLHGPTGDGSVADVAEGVRYAVDNDARVLNLSLTLPGYSQTLADAIAYADAQGALVVVAAGNSRYDLDRRAVSPPTLRLPNIISVAATTNYEGLASYSNYGRSTVDVAAPGGANSYDSSGVLSTMWPGANRGLYNYLAGTSMAAPHVAGLAALIWAAFPGLDHHAVKGRILNGVVPLASLNGRVITGGRIDAYLSLTNLVYPAVFNVTPASLPAGGLVTISGVNFGTTSGSVRVGNDEMTITDWAISGTRVEAETPPCGSSGRVQVNGAGSSFYLTLEQLPKVSIDTPTSVGSSPYTLQLMAQASDPNGQITQYAWDTGSGVFQSPQVGNSIIASFAAPGRYTVRVRVSDDCGFTVTGVRVVEITEEKQGSSDSRCFIATAAWGSSLHPRVQALRDFRDRYLMTSETGRALVALYYRLSPPLADFIRRRPALREFTVAALTPVVAVAEWTLALSGQPAADGEPLPAASPPPNFVPGELLLKFRGTVDEQRRQALLAEQGAEILRHSRSGLYYLRLPRGADTLRVIEWYTAQPEVEFAEPNYRVQKLGVD